MQSKNHLEVKFFVSILENFPSIIYNHIVFLIIVDLQLNNSFFSEHFIEVILDYFVEGYKFVTIPLLHFYLLILFLNRYLIIINLVDFFFFISMGQFNLIFKI